MIIVRGLTRAALVIGAVVLLFRGATQGPSYLLGIAILLAVLSNYGR